MICTTIRTQLFTLVASILLLSTLLTLIPNLAAQAATGFTTQTRLGFPAGDDWEPA